jgi:hypothetical protein
MEYLRKRLRAVLLQILHVVVDLVLFLGVRDRIQICKFSESTLEVLRIYVGQMVEV